MAKKPLFPKPSEINWDTVRELVFSLPGIEESTSYGTPALKVAGKLFVRKHQDGENIVVPMPIAMRTKAMQRQPDVFHITDHYWKFPYVLVRLGNVLREELAATLFEAWKRVAPKKLVAEYDAAE